MTTLSVSRPTSARTAASAALSPASSRPSSAALSRAASPNGRSWPFNATVTGPDDMSDRDPRDESRMSPDERRAEQLFKTLASTFLGAIEKTSERAIVKKLKETEDLVQAGILEVNRPIKISTQSTLLHTAAWFQKKEVIQWLLEHRADPNMPNLKGNTPLHLLAENGNRRDAAELIQLMIDYGGDIHLTDNSGESVVDKAKRTGGIDIMSFRFPKVIDKTSPEGQRAEEMYGRLQLLFGSSLEKLPDAQLITSLSEGELLIRSGHLDINRPIKISTGMTLLHAATNARKKDVIKWLLERKADPNVPNKKGLTPLHTLCENASLPLSTDLIQLMLDHGGDITRTDRSEPPQDSITKAKAQGLDLFTLRLNKKSDSSSAPDGDELLRNKAQAIHSQLSQSFSSLDGASPHQMERIIDTITSLINENVAIIRQGALSLSDPIPGSAVTFLHHAISTRHISLLRLLLQHHANPNRQDAQGETPLHLVCARCHEEWAKQVVMMMLEYGADTTITSYVRGLTPLEYAPNSAAKKWLTDAAKSKSGAASHFPGGVSFAAMLEKKSGNSSTAASPRTGVSRLAGHAQALVAKNRIVNNFKSNSPRPTSSSGRATPAMLDEHVTLKKGATGAKPDVLAGMKAKTQSVASQSATHAALAKQNMAGWSLGYHIQQLFDTLDLTDSGVLTHAQLKKLHHDVHSCSCPARILDPILDAHSCTRSNLMEVLHLMQIACNQSSQMIWDWDALDMDHTSHLGIAAAELVWNYQHHDVNQTNFEEFLRNRKVKSKQVGWATMSSDLLKLPNVKDYI